MRPKSKSIGNAASLDAKSGISSGELGVDGPKVESARTCGATDGGLGSLGGGC